MQDAMQPPPLHRPASQPEVTPESEAAPASALALVSGVNRAGREETVSPRPPQVSFNGHGNRAPAGTQSKATPRSNSPPANGNGPTSAQVHLVKSGGGKKRALKRKVDELKRGAEGESESAEENEDSPFLRTRQKAAQGAKIEHCSLGESVHDEETAARLAEEQREAEIAARVRKAEGLKAAAARRVVWRALFESPGVERDVLVEFSGAHGTGWGRFPLLDSHPGAVIECVAGSRMPNELVEELLDLTRANMRELYDDAHGWVWHDRVKRKELMHDHMRFFVVRAPVHGQSEASSSGPPPSQSPIVAFAAFRFAAEIGFELCYLHELQLSAQVRGRKLGSYLMHLIEHIASKLGMKIVMLTVLNNNPGSLKFYTKLGYCVDEASPGPCYNIEASAYDILSKVLDQDLLTFACGEPGCDFRCRFEDTLEQHAGYVHGKPWAFPCPVPGCNRGTVHRRQLELHSELMHGGTDSGPSPIRSPSSDLSWSIAGSGGRGLGYGSDRERLGGAKGGEGERGDGHAAAATADGDEEEEEEEDEEEEGNEEEEEEEEDGPTPEGNGRSGSDGDTEDSLLSQATAMATASGELPMLLFDRVQLKKDKRLGTVIKTGAFVCLS